MSWHSFLSYISMIRTIMCFWQVWSSWIFLEKPSHLRVCIRVNKFSYYHLLQLNAIQNARNNELLNYNFIDWQKNLLNTPDNSAKYVFSFCFMFLSISDSFFMQNWKNNHHTVLKVVLESLNFFFVQMPVSVMQ